MNKDYSNKQATCNMKGALVVETPCPSVICFIWTCCEGTGIYVKRAVVGWSVCKCIDRQPAFREGVGPIISNAGRALPFLVLRQYNNKLTIQYGVTEPR